MLLFVKVKPQVIRTSLELSTNQKDFCILNFLGGENKRKSPTKSKW